MAKCMDREQDYRELYSEGKYVDTFMERDKTDIIQGFNQKESS